MTYARVVFIALGLCLLLIGPVMSRPNVTTVTPEVPVEDDKSLSQVVYSPYLEIRVKTPVMDNLITRVSQLEKTMSGGKLGELKTALQVEGRKTLDHLKSELGSSTIETIEEVKRDLNTAVESRFDALKTDLMQESRDEIRALKKDLNSEKEYSRAKLDKLAKTVEALATSIMYVTSGQNTIEGQIAGVSQDLAVLTSQVARVSSPKHIESGKAACGKMSPVWGKSNTVAIKFSKPFTETPIIHLGVVVEDVYSNKNSRYNIRPGNVTRFGFNLVCSVWADTVVYNIYVNWISLSKVE